MTNFGRVGSHYKTRSQIPLAREQMVSFTVSKWVGTFIKRFQVLSSERRLVLDIRNFSKTVLLITDQYNLGTCGFFGLLDWSKFYDT